MSLLKAFQFVFEGDNTQLKKTVDDTYRAIKNLKKGVTETEIGTKKLGSEFGRMLSVAKIAQITSGVALAAIGASVKSATTTFSIDRFSKSIGFSIEEIDAWSRAIYASGGNAEAFRGSVLGLTNTLTEFLVTGGGGSGAEWFARLGISAFKATGEVKSALEVMLDVSDAFERLGPERSTFFGQQLGFDQGLILFLREGREEVQRNIKQQEKLGVRQKENADLSRKFMIAWRDTRLELSLGSLVVANSVLPVLTGFLDILKDIVNFARDNSKFIEAFFITIGSAIAVYYLPAITSAAIATTVAIAPFLAIAAAVAALGVAFGLIVEDIIEFSKGNDSLVGELLKKWPAVGETFKGVLNIIKASLNEIMNAGAFLAKFFTAPLEAIKELSFYAKNLGGDLKNNLTNFFPDVANTFRGVGRGNEFLTSANNFPSVINNASYMSSPVSRNNSMSVNTINVDARGGDSKEISSNVMSSMEDQFRQTVNEFDDGIKR